MPNQSLGNSGLSISRVVYGAMAFGRRPRDARVRTLHAAIEAGITSIDTAPLYEFGESEKMVGEAIADRRERVQVLSKVGLRWDDEHGDVLFTAHDEAGPRAVRCDSRPVSVRRDVEQSLRDLGIDALDLCQVHHPDVHVPIADTMGELLRLRDEGKLQTIGVSNYSAEQIEQAQQALGDVPLVSVQSQYNLLQREVERTVIPAAQAVGAGLLAYSPLAQGLLARPRVGRTLPASDWRRGVAAFHPTNVRRIEEAFEKGLLPLARRHAMAEAQIALAWVLAQPGVAAVIVGGSSVAQVQANAQAAELVLRAGERSGLAAMFDRVHLDSNVRPRRRDQILDRGERVLQGLAKRVGRRLPWG
ncbi:MAG: aldo/keto reductase [Deltaproteobacteria bacterium]|nr:aldo/keto reductase [Deltaproteobacteria bacterium]